MPEIWRLWHLCNATLDGLTRRRAGFDPVGGQQGFEFFRRGVVHQLFEDPLKVGEWIRSVAAHLLDECVDDRTAPAGVLAADEHPVLVAELGGADRVFGEVVVELDLPVHEAGFEVRQLIGGVDQGVAQFASGRDPAEAAEPADQFGQVIIGLPRFKPAGALPIV